MPLKEDALALYIQLVNIRDTCLIPVRRPKIAFSQLLQHKIFVNCEFYDGNNKGNFNVKELIHKIFANKHNYSITFLPGLEIIAGHQSMISQIFNLSGVGTRLT